MTARETLVMAEAEMSEENKGLWLSIEAHGPQGCGKSRMINELTEYLKAHHTPVEVRREFVLTRGQNGEVALVYFAGSVGHK